MNDPEQLLRAARLAAPSPELDRRLAAAFAQSEQTSAPAPRRAGTSAATPWAWFALYAGGAIAAAFVFVPSRSLPPPPAAPVVCQFEAEGAMRALLLQPSKHHATAAAVYSISVSTQ